MWTRSELKDRAKQSLRGYYWKAVVVCLIVGILGGGGAANAASASNIRSSVSNVQNALDSEYSDDYYGQIYDQVYEEDDFIENSSLFGVFLTVFLLVFTIVFVIAVVIGVFLGNPIRVGGGYFFLKSREGESSIGDIFHAFSSGYLNVVKTMFLRGLYTFLWSLLLLIPGVIKSYEYYMIPYILAENPNISSKRAFELSRLMMDGNKFNVWVLELSFILWRILEIIPFASLFIEPYPEATIAELYQVLRQDILDRGWSNTYELPGFGEAEQQVIYQ